MDPSSIRNAISKLDELKAMGIISDGEYQLRRGELIDRALQPGKGSPGYGARESGKGGKGHPGTPPPGTGFRQYPMWQSDSWQGGGWQASGRGKGKAASGNSDFSPQSRVLLVTFKDSPFPGHDAVAAHFSTVATVEKITHVAKPDREQALVQVATVDEAVSCVRLLNHSTTPWCHDIDVQRARISELTFKINDAKNKSYVALQPGRVLLLTLEGLRGPFPGLDAIYEMFKIYGTVERMSHISKPDREQCMIQFASPAEAAAAHVGLQNWNMGFCVFDLQVARTDALTFKQTDERNRDFLEQAPGQSA